MIATRAPALGHITRLLRAWAASMLAVYLPALYWANPGDVPAWYLGLMALGAALPLSGPPLFLAAVILIAARDRPGHGARAATACAVSAALALSCVMVYVRIRYG